MRLHVGRAVGDDCRRRRRRRACSGTSCRCCTRRRATVALVAEERPRRRPGRRAASPAPGPSCRPWIVGSAVRAPAAGHRPAGEGSPSAGVWQGRSRFRRSQTASPMIVPSQCVLPPQGPALMGGPGTPEPLQPPGTVGFSLSDPREVVRPARLALLPVVLADARALRAGVAVAGAEAGLEEAAADAGGVQAHDRGHVGVGLAGVADAGRVVEEVEAVAPLVVEDGRDLARVAAEAAVGRRGVRR